MISEYKQLCPVLFGNGAIKEIGKSMQSDQSFYETFDKYYNYKAMAALVKTIKNGDRAGVYYYMPGDSLSAAKADLSSISGAVDINYRNMTDQEVEELKPTLQEAMKKIETPHKKLKVKEIGDEYQYVYMPCFSARKVVYTDSSDKEYTYTLLFYDSKVVEIIDRND